MVGKYDPHVHHRRSVRSKGYDYAQAGAYFVTICAHERECLFGRIVGANGIRPETVLNRYGGIVAEEWVKSADIRQEIECGEWVVMATHIHGIVIISTDRRDGTGTDGADGVGANGIRPDGVDRDIGQGARRASLQTTPVGWEVKRLGDVADLDAALASAAVSLRLKLPLAASIAYTTARRGNALLRTQDADFDGLPEVRYFART